MSERSKLEQVLEFLLAEDNERAEELLHEYVVETARQEYERILDEDEVEAKDEDEADLDESEETEEEAVEETIDQADPENDFITDVEETDDEIESDEVGEMELDGEGEEGEGEEEELEDKVDELESELEDLRAEFEKLLSGDDSGDEEIEGDMEPEMGMEPEMEEESVEYDLDEEVAEDDDEVVEEATKLQDAVAAPKGGDAGEGESPFSKQPKSTTVSGPNGGGSPVKSTDGGEGNKGEGAKVNPTTDNIKVEPKTA
jgi:pilus assembly protein FimV|tara:strand:- start:235 stop:1008 length:774 start_codon:yes stop_codon:yes gene_type:complete